MIVTLDHIDVVANHCQTFWLQPEHPLDYTAGQFIEMTLPHNNTDNRGQKHWFTLSSSPTEELISITTKHASDGISTFKKVLFGLKHGSNITISAPMGDFVLPKSTLIPLLFVVGGIGITPVRSMIKWLIDKDESRDVQILYTARHLDDLAFLDLIQSYTSRTEIILSDPPHNWSGKSGQVSASIILKHAPPESLVYISGPELMVENLEKDLLKSDVPANRLVLDFFPGYN